MDQCVKIGERVPIPICVLSNSGGASQFIVDSVLYNAVALVILLLSVSEYRKYLMV